MEQTGQQNLFEIRVNAAGKIYIRKFASVIRWVILSGIIVTLIYITATIIRAIKVNQDIFSGNRLLLFEHRAMPFYTGLYAILFFLQLYYYWKIGSCLMKGINYNDEDLFNSAFEKLYSYSVCGLIAFILVMLMNTLDLYLTIKHYL